MGSHLCRVTALLPPASTPHVPSPRVRFARPATAHAVWRCLRFLIFPPSGLASGHVVTVQSFRAAVPGQPLPSPPLSSQPEACDVLVSSSSVDVVIRSSRLFPPPPLKLLRVGTLANMSFPWSTTSNAGDMAAFHASRFLFVSLILLLWWFFKIRFLLSHRRAGKSDFKSSFLFHGQPIGSHFL